MEEDNSKEMDVSYGVDKQEEVDSKPKKTSKKSKKTTKKKVVKEQKAPKKKNLIDEINEMKASGKINTPEFREKMSKLENILGVDEINPFGTNESDIFEDNLKSMNYADLRQLAHRVGVNPFQVESILRNVLKNEFKAQNKNNMRNIMPEASTTIKLDPNNPQHKKTLDILGEI
jgi:hypothetical protein